MCIIHESGRGRDGVIKIMKDLVLVKRNMLRYVQDVRAVRGIGRALSDHHVVLCKVRLVGAWTKRETEGTSVQRRIC